MLNATDCVGRLLALAGVRPLSGNLYDWTAVEGGIGLRLPEDYKLLAEKFPQGWFRRFARLLPLERNGSFLGPAVGAQLNNLREAKSKDPAMFPYPVLPESGGLLPWGMTIRGDLVFWLTRGDDPSDWPVIAAKPGYEGWRQFDGTACAFLTEVAAGRFDTSGFSEGPIAQVIDADGSSQVTAQRIDLATRPVFTPDPPRRSAVPPSGTRPDFWFSENERLGNDRLPADEFAALSELLGPPPAGVIPVDWDRVHARLGLHLPADYRKFADTFGAGTFGDITITTPGAGDLDLFMLLDRKASQVQGAPRTSIDAPVYPEPGGTISWGETADGYTCGWAPASKDPDLWSIVLIHPTPTLKGFRYRPGVSFSTSLKEYRIFAEQRPGLQFGVLPARDPAAGPVTFTPYRRG